VLLGCAVHWAAAAGGLAVGIPSGHIRVRCHSAALAQVELGLGTGSWAPGYMRDAVGNAFAWARRAGTAWSAAWAASTVVPSSCLVVVDVLAGAAVAGTGLGLGDAPVGIAVAGSSVVVDAEPAGTVAVEAVLAVVDEETVGTAAGGAAPLGTAVGAGEAAGKSSASAGPGGAACAGAIGAGGRSGTGAARGVVAGGGAGVAADIAAPAAVADTD